MPMLRPASGPGAEVTIQAGGDAHLYTNRSAHYMAHNLLWGVQALRATPITTSLASLDAEARTVSR